MTLPKTLDLIVGAAQEKKGDRPEVLDLRGLSSFTDAFVIVSGRSHRQVQAIADAVLERLRGDGLHAHHVEGHDVAEWILIDVGDVVVHVFLDEKRLFYDIEGLWRDAKRLPIAAATP